MTIEQLRAVHQARPFRPFTVNVANGRELRIRHPEFLSHHPQGRTIIVYGPNDSFEVVDLLLVTGLHVGNGHRRTPPPRARGR